MLISEPNISALLPSTCARISSRDFAWASSVPSVDEEIVLEEHLTLAFARDRVA